MYVVAKVIRERNQLTLTFLSGIPRPLRHPLPSGGRVMCGHHHPIGNKGAQAWRLGLVSMRSGGLYNDAVAVAGVVCC
jgi:hypothetical protein